MTYQSRPSAALAAAIAFALAVPLPGCAAKTRVNPHGAALKAFQVRLETYVAERNKVEGTLPALKETPEPADLKARQDLLRDAMLRQRRGTSPGNLITPEVAAIIRTQVRRDFDSRKPSMRRAAREEVPRAPDRVPKVNTDYPIDTALPTVPPKLLAALPSLPKVLEYRFLGRSVVIRDVDTNLIADVVPDALPPQLGSGGA